MTQPTATSDVLLCAKDEVTTAEGIHACTRIYPIQSLYISPDQEEDSRTTKSSSAGALGRSNLSCASILRRKKNQK